MSAVALLQLLHRLAKEDTTPKTVITSIHQPSSAVFRSFDKLMLLSDGKVVYFGNPVTSLEYLRRQNLACPDGYNAADHWMDVLVIDDSPHTNHNDEQEGDDDEPLLAPPKILPRIQLQQAWDNEAIAEQMDTALEADIGTTTKTDSSQVSLNGDASNNYIQYFLGNPVLGINPSLHEE
jgi:ABC-type multidrug transport system ATPase subunit